MDRGQSLVGCPCGGRNLERYPKRPEPKRGPFPGELGFVRLEYRGLAPSPKLWFGGFTGAAYRFGGCRTRGYIDVRDSVHFLFPATMGGAAPVFYPCACRPPEGDPI